MPRDAQMYFFLILSFIFFVCSPIIPKILSSLRKPWRFSDKNWNSKAEMAAPISSGSVELEKISQRGEFLGKKGWDRTPWTGAEPSTPSQGDWNWGKNPLASGM